MKILRVVLVVFIVSSKLIWATELPKACIPPGSMDQEDFIFAWVAETTRKGSQQQIEDANACLWKLWPKRDGAFVRVLVDNFLYLAERDIGVFLAAAPTAKDFSSLCKSVQQTGFVARSNSELRYLSSLRKSLLSKTSTFAKQRGNRVELAKAEELRKALVTADLREIQ